MHTTVTIHIPDSQNHTDTDTGQVMTRLHLINQKIFGLMYGNQEVSSISKRIHGDVQLYMLSMNTGFSAADITRIFRDEISTIPGISIQ